MSSLVQLALMSPSTHNFEAVANSWQRLASCFFSLLNKKQIQRSNIQSLGRVFEGFLTVSDSVTDLVMSSL